MPSHLSEKEKMLGSQPYSSRDPELMEMYYRARSLMKQFNYLDCKELDKGPQILKDLLGTVGDNVWIEAPFYVDYGTLISIGPGSFINLGCMFLDNNYITIGKNALIGPSVQIYTAEHPLNASDRIIENDGGGTSYQTSSRPVSIGENVWIGGNALIMPGVSIGDNVVIGAGSVVTKDVANNIVVAGNPAKTIKAIH